MDFMVFVFSVFWRWLAFVLLIAVTGAVLVDIIKALRPCREIEIYSFEDGTWNIKVKGKYKNGTAEKIAKHIDSLESRKKWIPGFRKVEGDDDL